MLRLWKFIWVVPMALSLVLFALMLLVMCGPTKAGNMLRAMSFGVELARGRP